MAILFNARGTPEPPVEVQRRVAAIHPGLSLRWVEVFDSAWCVTLAWSADDPRHAHVQAGDLDPLRACDIIGYLPTDCSVDEAPGYLAKMFREYPREDVQALRDGIARYNTKPLASAVEDAVAEVLDRADPSADMGPERDGQVSVPALPALPTLPRRSRAGTRAK